MNLLILGADGLPDLLTHDEDVGDHGVLVHRVDLADLAVLAGGQGGLVVLGAVNDAGLQRGVNVAVGHGDGNTAQIAHHVGLALHILHADLQALQVGGRADGAILRVEGACAGGVIGQRDKAVVTGGEEEVLHLLRVHDMVEVIGIVEDIGQAEGVEGIVVGGQTGCRNLGHGDNAGLQLLKVLVFAAELAVGEDLDLDAAIGLFRDLVRELGHGDVDRVGLGQAVGQSQHQRVLGAVAGGVGGGAGRAAAGHNTQTERSRSSQCCEFFEHGISPSCMYAVFPLAPSERGLPPQRLGERTVPLPEIFRAAARFNPSAPTGHLPCQGRQEAGSHPD